MEVKVYKYCQSMYNPLKGCQTLRLGTTSSFRKNYKGEGDFINDPKEGLADWRDIHRNTFASIQACPDGYIFCTVTKKLTFDKVHSDFDGTYDDCYAINDIHGFTQELNTLILFQLNYENINPKSWYYSTAFRNLQLPENKLGISCQSFRRKIFYRKDAKPRMMDNLSADQILALAHFHKPKRFEKQSEYRIFFCAFRWKAGLYLDIRNDNPLYIDTSSLMKYLQNC
ncbi:MAG: hypothetical protein WKF97_23855 [Chitinophagaceae bacterium]